MLALAWSEAPERQVERRGEREERRSDRPRRRDPEVARDETENHEPRGPAQGEEGRAHREHGRALGSCDVLVGPCEQHRVAQPEGDLLENEAGDHGRRGDGRGRDGHGGAAPQSGGREHRLARESPEEARQDRIAGEGREAQERDDPAHPPEPLADESLEARLPEDVKREARERPDPGERAQQDQHRRGAHDGEAVERGAPEGAWDRPRARLPHRRGGERRGHDEQRTTHQPGNPPAELGEIAAGDAPDDHERPRHDLPASEQPVRRARVALGPHPIDRPGLERTARERRAHGVDDLGHETVGKVARERVERIGGHAHHARGEERPFAPEAVGEGARRHLEHEHRGQVGGEHRVHLEEVETAAQEEQRVDRRDEELRERVEPGDDVVRALGAGHGRRRRSSRALAAAQTTHLHARRAGQLVPACAAR